MFGASMTPTMSAAASDIVTTALTIVKAYARWSGATMSAMNAPVNDCWTMPERPFSTMKMTGVCGKAASEA